jgi:hypothetical protein
MAPLLGLNVPLWIGNPFTVLAASSSKVTVTWPTSGLEYL